LTFEMELLSSLVFEGFGSCGDLAGFGIPLLLQNPKFLLSYDAEII